MIEFWSSSIHQPGKPEEPISWAFLALSEDYDALKELSEGMPGYQLIKWVKPGSWALAYEVFASDPDAIGHIEAELGFVGATGEVLNWSKQAVPGLPNPPEFTNFYEDPNTAKRYWVEACPQLVTVSAT